MRFLFPFLVALLLSPQLLAQQMNSSPEELRKKGIALKRKGDLDSAKIYYNWSKAAFLSENDSTGLANVLSNLGSIESLVGNYTQSLQNYYQAEKIYTSQGNIPGLVKVNINLANQFFKNKEFEEAKQRYLAAEAFSLEGNSEDLLGYIYNGLGNLYSSKYFEEVDFTAANEYFVNALHYYEKNGLLRNAAGVYNNIANIYIEQEQYASALKAYNQYYLMAVKVEDKTSQLIGLHNIAKVHLAQKQFEKAKEGLLEAESIALEIPDPINYINILSNLVDVSMNLGEVDSAKGYLTQYKSLKDSLYNEDKSEKLSELKVAYETEKKEEELAQEIALSNERKLRNSILSAVLFLLLIAIVVIILINRKSRLRERSRLKSEQEVETLRSSIEGEDKERKRLASDLHDSVGGMLTAARMIHSSYVEVGGEKANKVDHLLNDVSNTIRTVSHNLSTTTLERHGLLKSLEQAVAAIPEKFQINLIVDSEKLEVPTALARPIDFVIKELLNNTIKHSQATSIDIQLSFYDNTLIITYEDDGIGFDVSQTSDGIGLSSIQKRVALINGTIDINSKSGDGFVCSIEVPVESK